MSNVACAVSGLSPGIVYVVEVRAVGCTGRLNSAVTGGGCTPEVESSLAGIPLTTVGQPLDAVTHLSAQVTKQAPTSVKLSWQPPPYKQKVPNIYPIILYF